MSRTTTEPPHLRGFDFIRHLGSGGFADVFLYRQELPEREVAVKVLVSDEVGAASRQAFVAEANRMARLSGHPYIVSIHHADVSDDGRPYFVMEYCPGESLAARYKRRPLDVPEALQTGVRLSSAVATAHSLGILHRDIKPANVLANEFGWPLLTDFGIASATEEEIPSHTVARGADAGATGGTTQSQSVGMSIPWSPPEMFDDDPRPDVRSDVFSLGATIWTLLAGRTPFEVPGRPNKDLDLMSRIERGSITPMERDDVPPQLLGVLKKSMAVEPADRYATAAELARALQSVELQLGFSPTQIDLPGAPVVARPVATGDPDDATRARGVAVVAAQREPDADRTVVRGSITPVRADDAPPRVEPLSAPVPARAVASAPAATVLRGSLAAPTEVSPEPAPAPRRRRPLALVLVIAAVVLLAGGAGIAIAVGLSAGAPAPAATGATGGSSGSVDFNGTVPSVTGLVATRSADGASVVFTWKEPDQEAGDQYQWSRTDGSDTSVHTVGSPTATVTGVTSTTAVCIAVSVLRAGALSPTPTAGCAP